MKTSLNCLLLLAVVLLLSCGRKTAETKPSRMDISETVFASGTLEPEGKYNLVAENDGYIIELKFDDGDTVKKDQVLAIIDNKANNINAQSAENLLGIAARNASPEGPTLSQAEQSMQYLREKFAEDSVQFSRYQKLAQTNSVSKLELENAQLAYRNSKTNYNNALQNYKLAAQQTQQALIMQKSLKDVNSVANENNLVKAIVGGRIYKRMKENGDFLRRGDVIAVIGNTEQLYAKLSVDESNINKVKRGQEAILQLNTDKDRNYKGFVKEVYPAFDEPTQSFYCKVVFKEDIGFKIMGTQLQANIVVATKKNALVIPRNFLGYGDKVTVKGKGDVFVKTGFVSGEWVEILEGLSETDEISTYNLQ